MHGWCAEKENRGKGGSGENRCGSGFLPIHGSSRDLVGIQSGSSRDPVGVQSGSSRAPMSGGKFIKNSILAGFW